MSATLLWLIAAAVGGQGPTGSEPAGLPSNAQPGIFREIGFDQRLGETLPLDVRVRDENGAEQPLRSYFGDKPVLLSLNYFECPMLCGVALNGLASALETLSFDAGKEFEVVTLSFVPGETPAMAAAKKATYLERYKRAGAAQGWHFLTANKESIDAVTRAVGFRYAWDQETRQWAHPAGIVVLTPEGKIARYMYGMEYAPRDLRLAIVEASQRRVGSPVDQVLLYCFQYNPATGRYGATIMGILRLAGIVTVAALAGFVIVMLRRERRQARLGTAAG